MDVPECVYIMHISFFRSKIICFEIAVFCKISDGQVVLLPWKKIINILSFFIRSICKTDMSYLGTIYIVHIHLCLKEIFRLENGQFLVF